MKKWLKIDNEIIWTFEALKNVFNRKEIFDVSSNVCQDIIRNLADNQLPSFLEYLGICDLAEKVRLINPDDSDVSIIKELISLLVYKENINFNTNLCYKIVSTDIKKDTATIIVNILKPIVENIEFGIVCNGYNLKTETCNLQKHNVNEKVYISFPIDKDKTVVFFKKDNRKSFSDISFLLNNNIELEMVAVDGGAFNIGSNDHDASPNEKPSHEVSLNSYYIGRCLVTQELWKFVMGNNINGWIIEKGLGNNYPAYFMSWNDIQDFLVKLNEITGLKFRLPTEAEWEYAAKGGKKYGFKYSGSNDVLDVAWCKNNSNGVLQPIKRKKENYLGIYDMSGNVWEWCQDWFSQYLEVGETQGSLNGKYKVLRGGAYNNYPQNCRVTFRYFKEPNEKGYDIGFRLALDNIFNID